MPDAQHEPAVRKHGVVRTLWRSRWNLARLLVAGFLLWVLAADTGGRLARAQLAALPDFDYVSEIRHLRQAGRFGEAMMVADAGLDATRGQIQHVVLDERQAVENERASAMRRLKDVGLGALTGTAGQSGDASLERLGGAVAADLFVVGDIRDLVIQSGRYLVDGEADEVIVALSALGLATTLAPQVDWAPALLKIARKTGSLSKKMQEFIVGAVRSKRTKELDSFTGDMKVLVDQASPAGAIRLLKYADEPADAARLARFLERNSKGSRGAFALHVAGKNGADFLKTAERAGPTSAKMAEETLVAASRKGRAGVRWLETPAARTLMKAHPLIGVGKAFWKGNAEGLVRAALDRAGPSAWWLLPLAAAWVFVECVLLLRKWIIAR